MGSLSLLVALIQVLLIIITLLFIDKNIYVTALVLPEDRAANR